MHHAEKIALDRWMKFLRAGEEVNFGGIEDNFEERLRQISVEIRQILECAERFGGANGTNNSTVSAYRKRLIYQLGLVIRESSLEKRFRDFVEEELSNKRLRLRRKKKSKNAKSTFYACLRLVFPTEEVLKSGQKSNIASELQRAYKANISPDFLVGYIYQTNKSKSATKALERRLHALKLKRGNLFSDEGDS